MDTLRWLHLSDIHFKGNEEYATRRMRDMLIEKLKDISSEKPINMIFITGDLAYQGSSYEKELNNFIEEILSITHVSISNLYMIPGNHDLKRSQTRKYIIQGARENAGTLERETVKCLEKEFNQYNGFYKKIKREDNFHIYSIENRENVNIVLLNTALTAGTENDEGNLIIDKEHFFQTIKELKDKEECVNIVLGHHPISCFKTDNQKILINNFIDYNVDLYLCGHMHKGGYTFDLSGQRNIPSYQCGGGMVDDYATVTFIIGDLDLKDKSGDLIYYKWLQSEECWTQGGAEGRRAITGKIELVLDRFKDTGEESFTEIDVNEDEFRRFMMEFHEQLKKRSIKSVNLDPKDVFDKFRNMKCNKSIPKQYASFCRYFQVIDEIIDSSLLSQIEKESIPNIVISEYNKLIGEMTNGDVIIEGIVENIFNEYSKSFRYSNTILKTYFKILVYWSIYECDIFNDEL